MSPGFNLCDACVAVGIVSMRLCCRKELESLGYGKKKGKSADKEQDKSSEENILVVVAKEYSVENNGD